MMLAVCVRSIHFRQLGTGRLSTDSVMRTMEGGASGLACPDFARAKRERIACLDEARAKREWTCLPGRSSREARAKSGGEAGIRTLGRALRPYNGLANRRLQPLGHLTADVKYTWNQER